MANVHPGVPLAVAVPVAQGMTETCDHVMGAGGLGITIAQTMTNPAHFTIKDNVQRGGCCWLPSLCNCCNPHVKARSYIVIGDNFLETNDAVPCCCCGACDLISKTYFDFPPFKRSCCQNLCSCIYGSKGAFTTEKDYLYACGCIPTVCCYDMCSRPCYGGTVWRSAVGRDSPCFCCATRCLPAICCAGLPLMSYVADSDAAAAALEKAYDEFLAKQRNTGDVGGAVAASLQ